MTDHHRSAEERWRNAPGSPPLQALEAEGRHRGVVDVPAHHRVIKVTDRRPPSTSHRVSRRLSGGQRPRAGPPGRVAAAVILPLWFAFFIWVLAVGETRAAATIRSATVSVHDALAAQLDELGL